MFHTALLTRTLDRSKLNSPPLFQETAMSLASRRLYPGRHEYGMGLDSYLLCVQPTRIILPRNAPYSISPHSRTDVSLWGLSHPCLARY